MLGLPVAIRISGQGGATGSPFLLKTELLERGDVRACDAPERLQEHPLHDGRRPHRFRKADRLISMPGRPSVRHQQVGKGCGQVRPVSVLWGVKSVIELFPVAAGAPP